MMAASRYNHNGGGMEFLCMHPTPQFPPGWKNQNNNGNLLYGVEYQNTGSLDKNHDKDAACAVCQRDGATTTYVQWGRRTCSNGHRTEYAGLIMGNHYTQKK